MKENIFAGLVLFFIVVLPLGIYENWDLYSRQKEYQKQVQKRLKTLIEVPHLDCPKTMIELQKNVKYLKFEPQKGLHQVGVGIHGNLRDHEDILVQNYCFYSTDTNLLVGELY